MNRLEIYYKQLQRGRQLEIAKYDYFLLYLYTKNIN
jgi:hypothetical protein